LTLERGMFNKLLKYILPLPVLAAMLFYQSADAVVVENRISISRLTVGDKFLYISSIKNLDGAMVQPILSGEKLGDAYLLSGIFEYGQKMENEISYACTLAVYATGRIRLPSLAYTLTNPSGAISQAAGDSLEIEVLSVLPADTAGLDIADIRGPRRVPVALWPYPIFILGLGLLLAGAIYLRKKLRKRQAIPIVAADPPWEVALRKLDELHKKRHIDFGRFPQFYFELSLIVREYIEALYNIPAVESTTFELETMLRNTPVSGGSYERLFSLFYRADLAKFARTVPTAQDARADIEYSYEFIRISGPPLPDGAAEFQEQEIKAD